MPFRILFRSTSSQHAGATNAFWEYCPFSNVVVTEKYIAMIVLEKIHAEKFGR